MLYPIPPLLAPEDLSVSHIWNYFFSLAYQGNSSLSKNLLNHVLLPCTYIWDTNDPPLLLCFADASCSLITMGVTLCFRSDSLPGRMIFEGRQHPPYCLLLYQLWTSSKGLWREKPGFQSCIYLQRLTGCLTYNNQFLIEVKWYTTLCCFQVHNVVIQQLYTCPNFLKPVFFLLKHGINSKGGIIPTAKSLMLNPWHGDSHVSPNSEVWCNMQLSGTLGWCPLEGYIIY